MIRKAIENDIPGIMALYEEYIKQHIALDPNLAPFNQENNTYPSYLRSSINNDKSLLLVSVHHEVVKGYLLAQVVSLPPVFNANQKLAIQDLAVGTQYHRQGLAGNW